MKKPVPLSGQCIPVGTAHNGMGLYRCPDDLIKQLKALERLHVQVVDDVVSEEREDSHCSDDNFSCLPAGIDRAED